MTNTTFKSPLAVLLLATATLLAVVGHHAATGQDDPTPQDGNTPQVGFLPQCFMNCRFRVISCTTGCRIGAGPFPFSIRFCLNQCTLQNFQCLQNCVIPRPYTPQRPPRRPILPPIFHRPPRRPILPPIFHRPPGSPLLPPIFHRPPGSILPPIFHRPPGSILPPIFHRPPSSPIEPHPIPLPPPRTLIYRPPPVTSTLATTQDPLPSFTLPLPPLPAQVDHLGNGN